MKSSRRVARKIGNDDEDEEGSQTAEDGQTSVVRRPGSKSHNRSKPKQSSSLRTSFKPNDEEEEDAGEEALSRQVQERRRNDPLKDLPLRATSAQESRPQYSAEHLSELRNSAQSTPRAPSEEASAQLPLDIASKFGDSALALSQSEQTTTYHIPSEAEIREKKERRRRLAKEQDFISFDDAENADQADSAEESEDGDYKKRSLIIHAEDDFKEQSKYGETRLVHEDEDIAEGFDDFVEDSGKVALGRKAAKEQEKERRKAIEEQIRNAQHGHSSDKAAGGDSEDDELDQDPEEAARNAAYDAAQTKAGTYGLTTSRRKEKDAEERLRAKLEMPKVKPVPDFKSVLLRFTDMVSAKENEINVNKKKLEKLEKEKVEIEEDESRVKDLLREAGEKYEKLKNETGEPHGLAINGHAENQELQGPSDTSMGAASDSEDQDTGEQAANSENTFGQAFGAFRQPPSGMSQIARDEEDDWY